jgi:bacterioferritin-associated ferredoxin
VIVCVCHVVSDKTIREAAEAGANADEIGSKTGAGRACGCCRETVEAFVQRARAKESADGCAACPRRRAA